MPYYPEINCLFIHIPKTGGTVIENELKKIYTENLYNENSSDYKETNILPYPENNISPQHQFYKTIQLYKDNLNINFDEKLKTFAIVRNPYDRIISDLFWLKLIDKNTNPSEIYNIIINNYLKNNFDNHPQPQYKFVTDKHLKLFPNIKIFKIENLNEENNLLNKFLGTNIDIKQQNINKDYSKYLNEDSIALINYTYEIDFKLFNYKMKKDKLIKNKYKNLNFEDISKIDNIYNIENEKIEYFNNQKKSLWNILIIGTIIIIIVFFYIYLK